MCVCVCVTVSVQDTKDLHKIMQVHATADDALVAINKLSSNGRHALNATALKPRHSWE